VTHRITNGLLIADSKQGEVMSSMSPKLLLKGAILAALTINSAMPAYAQKADQRGRPNTQKPGGESGGGNPRIALSTEEGVRELLKEMTNHESDESRTPIFLNPKIFLFNKPDLTDEERTSISQDAIMGTRYDGGPNSGKVRIEFPTDSEYVVKIGEPLDEEFKSISNKEFANALKRIFTEKMIVDYKFVKGNETLFKKAFERYNPQVRFDAEEYRNLLIEVEKLEVASEMTEFKVQEAPCLPPKKSKSKDKTKHNAMSVKDFTLLASVCISSKELLKIPELSLGQEVLALTLHEMVHKFGYEDETIPDWTQDFILKEVVTKRFDLRNQIRLLAVDSFDALMISRELRYNWEVELSRKSTDPEEIKKGDEIYLENWKSKISASVKVDMPMIAKLIEDYATLTRAERNRLKSLHTALINVMNNAKEVESIEELMAGPIAEAKKIANQMVNVIPPRKIGGGK